MGLLALLLSISLGAASTAPPLAAHDAAALPTLSHALPAESATAALAPVAPAAGPNVSGKYFGARYYGSRIGRFTTTDPYMDTSGALLNPQRWNRYSYGLNNPLRNVDPDGRDAWDIATGAANAFGSNFSLGLGRQSGNSDFAKGQFIGDLASIPAGYAWGDVGATLAGAGLIGAPETGGVTLVATGAGVAIMVQGGTASLAGIANAGIYLSKNKTASDMANDLAGRIGKNSVPFETPGQKGRIDLQGKGHFDKATGQTIETPHVQTRPKHVGPQGKVNTGPETTRPATKGDIRTAEKLVERKQ
jgi:RHS repeat-associated protein